MRKYLVVFAAVLLVAGTAYAGPIPPGGWGKDCTQWITYSDPWASGEMCYDPALGSGGAGWRSCTTHGAVTWPGLDIELWIEMECAFAWDATHAQIHRASDYSDFVLDFCGWSACNHGQYIITTPPTGGSLDFLPFVSQVAGSAQGTNIPLTWLFSLDGSTYAPMTNDGDGTRYFLVDKCDHHFCIRVVGDIAYHQGDGYYHLGGQGASICPAEPL
jgi:hypothetical protein